MRKQYIICIVSISSFSYMKNLCVYGESFWRAYATPKGKRHSCKKWPKELRSNQNLHDVHPGLSKLIDEVFPWRKRNINTKSISWPALWWSPATALPLPSPPCCWWHCPEPGLDGNEKVSWPRCNHSGRCNHRNHHAANQLDLVVIIIIILSLSFFTGLTSL